MPDRACDFCENRYKNNPHVGYYKVTENIRISLRLDSMLDSNYDFICGFHFPETAFDESGRLVRDSIPTFCASRESLQHDHDYIGNAEETPEVTGKQYLENFQGANNFHYIFQLFLACLPHSWE